MVLSPGVHWPRATAAGGGAARDCAAQDLTLAACRKTDAVTVLLARTTAQLQAVERELAEERVKLEYTEEEILEMERKEEQAEAVSERSWQADSVDSGCSSCAQTSPPHPEPCCVGVDSIHGHTFAGQADPYSPEKLQPPALKVDKETNTEDLFPEEVASLRKERPSRRARGSPFVRAAPLSVLRLSLLEHEASMFADFIVVTVTVPHCLGSPPLCETLWKDGPFAISSPAGPPWRHWQHAHP